MLLRDGNLDKIKTILNELEAGTATKDNQQITAFYTSMMDEETIEMRGCEPIRDMLKVCICAHDDPTTALATLNLNYGISGLFRIGSSPDKKNSKHTILSISQGGLTLPDEAYYHDADKEDKRCAYKQYIAATVKAVGPLLEELGFDGSYKSVAGSQAAAQRILDFETELAASHLTRTQLRDPELTYNMMNCEELQAKCKAAHDPTWASYLTTGTESVPCVDFGRYLALVGVPEESCVKFNVSSVSGVAKGGAIAFRRTDGSATGKVLSEYLVFKAVNSMAKHLPKAFVEARFDFFEKTLKGTKEQRPRWKEALEALEDAMGDLLGKLYVGKYFNQSAKDKALHIVRLVQECLQERLHEVDWMSDKTRKEALRKMDAFRVKIGFPDKWVDYTALEVKEGRHFENVLASRLFDHKRDMDRMGKPTDRDRWFMTPQTINAYFHPLMNEIVFPAAILQPPFFDPESDDAANFGVFGAVVGHEMTHGFDDSGRMYDADGNLRDWWAENDGAEYEARADVMIKQAERHEVHGVKLKGKLTCGENIADLGGLKLAYRALNKALKDAGNDDGGSVINGYNARQRFFIAWASAWRQNATRDRELQLVTIDPHGPNEFRANGPLTNIPEFYEAFDIKPGDDMYRPPEERVDIW